MHESWLLYFLIHFFWISIRTVCFKSIAIEVNLYGAMNGAMNGAIDGDMSAAMKGDIYGAMDRDHLKHDRRDC